MRLPARWKKRLAQATAWGALLYFLFVVAADWSKEDAVQLRVLPLWVHALGAGCYVLTISRAYRASPPSRRDAP